MVMEGRETPHNSCRIIVNAKNDHGMKGNAIEWSQNGCGMLGEHFKTAKEYPLYKVNRTMEHHRMLTAPVPINILKFYYYIICLKFMGQVSQRKVLEFLFHKV